ncbi:hypothetical protein T484DRAFT_1860169 [Baffinella frigidus]|nr:hypothetical protein T484DRAFT_1860169 [Cryptophyta sp. CCMP2293]
MASSNAHIFAGLGDMGKGLAPIPEGLYEHPFFVLPQHAQNLQLLAARNRRIENYDGPGAGLVYDPRDLQTLHQQQQVHNWYVARYAAEDFHMNTIGMSSIYDRNIAFDYMILLTRKQRIVASYISMCTSLLFQNIEAIRHHASPPMQAGEVNVAIKEIDHAVGALWDHYFASIMHATTVSIFLVVVMHSGHSCIFLVAADTTVDEDECTNWKAYAQFVHPVPTATLKEAFGNQQDEIEVAVVASMQRSVLGAYQHNSFDNRN